MTDKATSFWIAASWSVAHACITPSIEFVPVLHDLWPLPSCVGFGILGALSARKRPGTEWAAALGVLVGWSVASLAMLRASKPGPLSAVSGVLILFGAGFAATTIFGARLDQRTPRR
ncbi:MAG: hypothetical protein H6825_03140 [Planctomycetes bacterium]|nr:hypothetical protein [Planctomycetota bacterium]